MFQVHLITDIYMGDLETPAISKDTFCTPSELEQFVSGFVKGMMDPNQKFRLGDEVVMTFHLEPLTETEQEELK